MIGAIVLSFLVGVSVGVLIARRGQPHAAERQHPQPAPPSRVAAPGPLAGPSKRGRKAGLTEESFQPADDILDKLRLVAEGQLDPSVLRDELSDSGVAPRPEAATAPRPAPEPEAEAAPPPIDPALSEAEQRVLDRLRRMAPPSDADDRG